MLVGFGIPLTIGIIQNDKDWNSVPGIHYISTWSAKMERKNLTRWAVYQSDVKYKLWNAKNIYDIIKLTTFAAFVKPPSYIRKKLKSFFAVFARV